MHTFCRECIQKRLDVRNRKCPACALQFDFQSVKDLFLTA
jgi:E3 ubiquitin-protein ligase BRE1